MQRKLQGGGMVVFLEVFFKQKGVQTSPKRALLRKKKKLWNTSSRWAAQGSHKSPPLPSNTEGPDDLVKFWHHRVRSRGNLGPKVIANHNLAHQLLVHGWFGAVWIPIGSCNLKALVSAAKLQGFMFWMFFQEFVPYMGPFLDTLHLWYMYVYVIIHIW